MAETVAEHGLVQVMRRDDRRRPDAGLGRHAAGGIPPGAHRPGVPRRLGPHAERIAAAVRSRLRRQQDAGVVRSDVEIDGLAGYLELVLEGLVAHLAAGLPADRLGGVLDLVEGAVRR